MVSLSEFSSLESMNLPFFSVTLLYTTGRILWACPKLCQYASLKGFQALQMDPLNEQIRWIGILSVYNNVLLDQKVPDTQHTQSCYFSDMPKYLVTIFQTISFCKSSWPAIIWTVNKQSPHTTCITHSMLTSVLQVKELPLLESSFTF